MVSFPKLEGIIIPKDINKILEKIEDELNSIKEEVAHYGQEIDKLQKDKIRRK